MAIKDGSILQKMLLNSKVSVRVGSIILEYAALKQKLDNPESQDWYFRKGIASNREKLINLENSFRGYQAAFNSCTVNTLIKTKNELLAKLETVDQINGHFIRAITVSSFIQKINHAEEFLMLKSRIDYLHDIDFYLANSDELNKVLEV